MLMDANENEFEFACIRVRSRLKLLGTGFKKTQRCGERREISLGRVHSLVTRLKIGLSGGFLLRLGNILPDAAGPRPANAETHQEIFHLGAHVTTFTHLIDQDRQRRRNGVAKVL